MIASAANISVRWRIETTSDLTHEFLAYVLGVTACRGNPRGELVARAALIGYRRGAITILDNAGLEKASCPCYRQGKMMYAQIMDSRRGQGAASYGCASGKSSA